MTGALAAAALALVPAGHWHVHDLGALVHSDYTEAHAISAGGDVLVVKNPDVDESAFVWHRGRVKPLGIAPAGMNAAGDVAGTFTDPNTARSRAKLWHAGTFTTLPPLPGDTSSEADAIADNGIVAGLSARGYTHEHVVVWRNGRVTDLGRPPVPRRGAQPGVEGVAADGTVAGEMGTDQLTDKGRVVTDAAFVIWHGRASLLFGSRDSGVAAVTSTGTVIGQVGKRVFVWRAGRITYPAFPATMSGVYVSAVNARGDFVGGCSTCAFLWQNGAVTLLNGLDPARASININALNDHGVVVGSIASKAFVWANGRVTRLPSLAPGAESEAFAVNDAGAVVGYSATGTGDQAELHAVLWTFS